MLLEEITKIYFSEDTRGYNILSKYYFKYRDLFKITIHNEFSDFLNEILLNVSSIKFSDDIRNKEAYIIGTLKIQCRVQLDKALKQKNRIKIVDLEKNEDKDTIPPIQNILSENSGPDKLLELQEIFNTLQYFKATINSSEIELLNNLIDEVSRKKIAELKNVNMNTLDTQIRRLRLKFISYLKDSGHDFNIFKKYQK